MRQGRPQAPATASPTASATASGLPVTVPTPDEIADCRVLVVGDVMLDSYLFGEVDRISPEAPVPVVRVSREEDRLGGAANVALNAKHLGAQVTLLTVLGKDDAAFKLEAMLREAGIKTGLYPDFGLRTTMKMRVIGRAQQVCRIDFDQRPAPAALGQLLQMYLEHIAAHDVVLLSDYGKGGLAGVQPMIDAARAAGVPVLVDPKGSNYVRYERATVITPNLAEMTQAVHGWESEDELRDKAELLRAGLGIEALLLKRSSDGMTLFEASGATDIPADAHEVYDVTGAGDTVLATLGVLVGCCMTVREAAPHANRAGGIVVGKFGTATVSPAELFPQPRTVTIEVGSESLFAGGGGGGA